MKRKVLIIVGPTASGKTALALKLAGQLNAELLSADSRQIYKKMDIVTGKDLPENSKFKVQNLDLQKKIQEKLKTPFSVGRYDFNGVSVWGLDIVYPDEDFSAAHFAVYGKFVLEDIALREKNAIVVGGTGFWIKVLSEGAESIGIPPDKKLRKRLAEKNAGELFVYLSKIDMKKANSMNMSDRKNPRRLIRAIEIAENKKLCPKKIDKNFIEETKFIKIGLKTDINTAEEKIKQRIEQRIKAGALEETKSLLVSGYGFALPSMTACGYRVFEKYFRNNLDLDTLKKIWFEAERSYLKRQMTWFNKEKKIRWFDIVQKDCFSRVVELVKNCYDRG